MHHLESHVCGALDGEGMCFEQPSLNGSLAQLKVMETGSLLMQKGENYHIDTVIGRIKS